MSYQCPNMEVIKVLVNGGIGVGKSSLLFSYEVALISLCSGRVMCQLLFFRQYDPTVLSKVQKYKVMQKYFVRFFDKLS